MTTKGYLTTRHGQVHYATQGSGPPLLLIHQTPRSSRMFNRLGPILANSHRVVAVDTLGSGSSDPLPAGLLIHDIAQIAIQVLDELKIKQADVFGIHSGAAIAAEIAAGWPSRVDRLILHGLLAVGKGPEREAALSARLGNKKFVSASDGSHAMSMWYWAYLQKIRDWWNTSSVPDAKLTATDIENIEACFLDLMEARTSADGLHQAVFNYAWEERLPLIKAKTLLIEGAGRFESGLARRSARLQPLLKDSSLVSLPNADANVAEWQAPDLAKIILNFLKR